MTPEQIAALPYRPCVGVMLANRQGRVFVGQRIDNPGPALQMPQGGIDKGESARDAALRELWEETGVTRELVEILGETPDTVRYELPPDLVPKLWKGRYRGQEQTWFLMRFLGQDDQVRIDTRTPEFSDWQWLDPAQLVDRIVPFKRAVYAEVLDAFGPALARLAQPRGTL